MNGIYFDDVPVFRTFRLTKGDDAYNWSDPNPPRVDRARLSKQHKAMLKVVGEYLEAGYKVKYSEEVRDGQTYASVRCTPPLMEDEE